MQGVGDDVAPFYLEAAPAIGDKRIRHLWESILVVGDDAVAECGVSRHAIDSGLDGTGCQSTDARLGSLLFAQTWDHFGSPTNGSMGAQGDIGMGPAIANATTDGKTTTDCLSSIGVHSASLSLSNLWTVH